MSDDELDLSEFEEFSSTARQAAGKSSGGSSAGGGSKGGPKGGTPGKAKAGTRGPRRWPWLLVGVAFGIGGTLYLPGLAAPYLPDTLRPGVEEVRGPVLGKRVEGDRVLLTVDGSRGALLATFRQRVPEIDLLVSEGDTVVLRIEEYAPLVEDPGLVEVRKGSGAQAAEPAAPDSSVMEPGADADPDGEPGTEAEIGSGAAAAPDSVR